MVYTVLFLVGLLGMTAMLLLGVGRGHGGGHGGHGGHAHPQGHGQGRADRIDGRRAAGVFLQMLSPLTLMSFCLGAGATGLILSDRHLPPTVTAVAASLGAVVFYGLIIRPLMSLAFRFASNPAEALEGTMAKTAEAASKFDERGRGVVKVNVDGQVVRVLADLDQEDRLNANLIKPGDALMVTAVDGRRNRCTVTRL